MAATRSISEHGRIAEARHNAGLNQRELANRIGVPLWTVDRIESGTEDPGPHIAAIAAATGREPALLLDPGTAEEVTRRSRPSLIRRTHGWRRARWRNAWIRNLILGAVVLLVTIRFFAEEVHVLPRAVKLVDVPILLGLMVLYWIVPRVRHPSAMSMRYLLLAVAFFAVCIASVLINSNRTEPGPSLLFIYGFLAPILVFHLVRTLWPAGQALALSKVLVALAWIELLVVAGIDLPQYLKHHNPDVVSGTFGENAYQLVFFMLVAVALVAGIATIERKRTAARLAPLFFAGTAAAILLAQYRAILLSALLAVLFVTVLLGLVRVRGALAGVLVAITFIAALSAIPAIFPELKIQDAVNSVTGQPGVYIKARWDAGSDIPKIYTDQPSAVVIGAGPGAVNSRAWGTFYRDANRDSLGLVLPVPDRQTDIAEKYTIPHQEGTGAIDGSFLIANPFASYYALLAEVGILGFVLMVFIYGRALVDATRMSLISLRKADDGDPLPVGPGGHHRLFRDHPDGHPRELVGGHAPHVPHVDDLRGRDEGVRGTAWRRDSRAGDRYMSPLVDSRRATAAPPGPDGERGHVAGAEAPHAESAASRARGCRRGGDPMAVPDPRRDRPAGILQRLLAPPRLGARLSRDHRLHHRNAARLRGAPEDDSADRARRADGGLGDRGPVRRRRRDGGRAHRRRPSPPPSSTPEWSCTAGSTCTSASPNERYLEAAVRGGEYLRRHQDDDGAWRGEAEYFQIPHTYCSRVSWALLRLADVDRRVRLPRRRRAPARLGGSDAAAVRLVRVV